MSTSSNEEKTIVENEIRHIYVMPHSIVHHSLGETKKRRAVESLFPPIVVAFEVIT